MSKHDLQKVYELRQIDQAISETSTLFSDFVNKLEIWRDLEAQYETKQDAQKTQAKYQEIYQQLKNYFDKESDEKQE